MLVSASMRSDTELIEVKIKSILDCELAPVTLAGVEFKTVGVSACTVLFRIGDIMVDMRVDFRRVRSTVFSSVMFFLVELKILLRGVCSGLLNLDETEDAGMCNILKSEKKKN